MRLGTFEGKTMRKVMIAALAALASMSTTAYAADMYSKGSMKDGPVEYEAPVFTWAGLYVGGSAGFGVGDTSGQLKFDNYREIETKSIRMEQGFDFGSLFSSDYDVNGAIYGAHIGYNFQRGNLVFGAELGLNGTDMDGSDSCGILGLAKCERALDWYATAVGRLGYASGRTLFYGFGGVAWGEVQTDVSFFGISILQGEETHVGWTAGLGIEHALSDRFSVRVEYSHVDLGEEDHSFGEGLSSEVDLSFDAIKVGASYKIFGDHAPLESLK
jgi:outer membrane immunogenic protein